MPWMRRRVSDMAEIVKAGLSELEDILAVEQTCFSVPWSEKSISDGLTDERYCFLIAVCESKTVGYGSILTACDECDLLNVAVLPEYRGRGIGRAIVNGLIREAKSRGAAAIHLEVRESNENAIGLYLSLGFSPDGTRRNYYKMPQENAVLMTKTL